VLIQAFIGSFSRPGCWDYTAVVVVAVWVLGIDLGEMKSILLLASAARASLIDDVELRGVIVRCRSRRFAPMSKHGFSHELPLGPPAPACSPPMCAAMFFQEWPRVAFHSPDLFGRIRCDGLDGNATQPHPDTPIPPFCTCFAGPVDTPVALHDAGLNADIHITMWGDSTTREAQSTIAELSKLAAMGHAAATGDVVELTRGAIDHHLAIDPANETAIPLSGVFFRFHHMPHPEAKRGWAMINRHPLQAGATYYYHRASYRGLRAGIDEGGRAPNQVRRERAARAHVVLLNDGVHHLATNRPGGRRAAGHHVRPLGTKLISYRADIAEAFHTQVRRALTSDSLKGLVLTWRATVHICQRRMYGAWREAANSVATALLTPRSPGQGMCEAVNKYAWDTSPEPPWGAIRLGDACAWGVLSPKGSEWINGLAAETVRLLNRCYLTENGDGHPFPTGFPCPDDVRGVALRRKWRLPGIYWVSYHAITKELCGRVDCRDGIHMYQSYLPMFRAIVAAVQLSTAVETRGNETG